MSHTVLYSRMDDIQIREYYVGLNLYRTEFETSGYVYVHLRQPDGSTLVQTAEGERLIPPPLNTLPLAARR